MKNTVFNIKSLLSSIFILFVVFVYFVQINPLVNKSADIDFSIISPISTCVTDALKDENSFFIVRASHQVHCSSIRNLLVRINLSNTESFFRFSPALNFLLFLSCIFLFVRFVFLRKPKVIRLPIFSAPLFVVFMSVLSGLSYLIFYQPGKIVDGTISVFPYLKQLPDDIVKIPLLESLVGLFVNSFLAVTWVVAMALFFTVFGMRILKGMLKNSTTTAISNFLLQIFQSSSTYQSDTPSSLFKIFAKKFEISLRRRVFQHAPRKIDGFFSLKLVEKGLVGFSIGAFFISLILFGLSLCGLLNVFTVIILFAAALVFSRNEFLEIIKGLVGNISFSRSQLPLWIFLFGLIGTNIREVIKPVPLGWDDLGRYQNIAKYIGTTGSIPNGLPTPWELIMSLGYILTGNPTASLLLSFMGGLIAFLAIALLLNKVIKNSYLRGIITLLVITLFASMPAVFVQSSQDLKIDLPLLGIIGVALLLLFIAREKSSRSLSYLSFFIFGFAFSIKYTVLFIAIPVFFVVAYGLFTRMQLLLIATVPVLFFIIFASVLNRFGFGFSSPSSGLILLLVGLFLCFTVRFIKKDKNFTKNLMIIVIYGVFFLLPLSPWYLRNAFIAPNLTVENIVFGLNEEPDIAQLLPPFVPEKPVSATASKEELGRYLGYQNGIIKYLLLPIRATLNTAFTSMGTVIGFIWLAMIIGLAYFIPFKKIRENLPIIFITSFYWILWAIFANGVIWYGFPGFIGLMIILAWQLESVLVCPIFKYMVGVVFVFWFFVSITTRFQIEEINPEMLLYSSRLIPAQEALQRSFPSWVLIAQALNKNEEDAKESSLIYHSGTYLRYFIDDNFKRIFNDPQLDTFNLLFSEGDRELTTQRLRHMGFEYFLIGRPTAVPDSIYSQTLKRKFLSALKYLGINDNFKVVSPNTSLEYLYLDEKIAFIKLLPVVVVP